MSGYTRCPNCGRKAETSVSSSSCFPVFRCIQCGKIYCVYCGAGHCPSCRSPKSTRLGYVQNIMQKEISS